MLDTLSAGLVLDGGIASSTACSTSWSAAHGSSRSRHGRTRRGRGATEASSIEFRGGRAREREGDALDRAGDRAQAIRALWAAAELYDRAVEGDGTRARPVAGAGGSATAPPVAKAETPPPPPERQPAPAATAAAPSVDDTAASRSPGRPSRDAGSAADVARDGRTSDIAAIREHLRRYAEAYRAATSVPSGKVLPSLTRSSCAASRSDFSNYRSYNVEIADARIVGRRRHGDRERAR